MAGGRARGDRRRRRGCVRRRPRRGRRPGRCRRLQAGLADLRASSTRRGSPSHDTKSLRLGGAAADDTLLAAYLVDPGRSGYALDELAVEHGLELVPDPATEESTAQLVCAAEAARRLAPILREKVRERGAERLYDEIELPLTVVLGEMEDVGIRIDTYRMGEITARLTDRVEELEARAIEAAGEEFQLGSTQQLARILFEKLGLQPGRKGKTGYSTDARVLRDLRGEHPIVELIEEWRELTKLLNTYLAAAADPAR